MLELNMIMNHIERIYKAIKAIPDPVLQRHYAVQSMPITDEFEEIAAEVKIALEDQFEYERQNNLPPNLSYRKLYKNLFSE